MDNSLPMVDNQTLTTSENQNDVKSCANRAQKMDHETLRNQTTLGGVAAV